MDATAALPIQKVALRSYAYIRERTAWEHVMRLDRRVIIFRR